MGDREVKSKKLVEDAINQVCASIDAVNLYWEISKTITSIGWDGAKINDDDLVITFHVNIMGDRFSFRALHTYNKERCAWKGEPELVKVYNSNDEG